ncbi:hypothetical protein T8S45_01170 [Blastomonas marina]|uniref:hypothetical protein n=1 Tax=Blastomonas marina TaxID=1867408 RepID=UPI002AC9DA45|nr:hypothetical protein [Blastomonas marina]WPZ04171.1 hypothetical protein T8S45_01170 [Blastomonas marina]
MESTESLRAAMRGALSIRRVVIDCYGHTLGVIYANGVNLSCHQLATGNAIYRRDWDDGDAVRKDCPRSADTPPAE